MIFATRHETEWTLEDDVLSVVYLWHPGCEPSPRTMSHPMGVDDGAPPVAEVIEVCDEYGARVDLTKDEEGALLDFIYENHEEE